MDKKKLKTITLRWVVFIAVLIAALFFGGSRSYTENTADLWKALFVFILGIIAIKLIEIFIVKKFGDFAEKTRTKIDDLVVFVTKESVPFLYIAAFYIALYQIKYITNNSKYLGFVNVSFKVIASVYVVYILIKITDWFTELYIKKETSGPKVRSLRGLDKILKVVIYSFGVVLILANLGLNVTALITGLGISGVAVALAAQKILEDLFNYFVIILDKPFEEGDFIVFGDFAGTVEFIGLKSTRIRSLSGEQIIVSNSNLLGEKVQNYKRMKERRVVFKFGVIYETPLEKLKKIPGLVKEIINGIEGARFDRCHFVNFGDYSLDFETVYYVNDSDYLHYMNIHQAINLQLAEKFSKEGIEFAYPTQVVYINRSESEDSN